MGPAAVREGGRAAGLPLPPAAEVCGFRAAALHRKFLSGSSRSEALCRHFYNFRGGGGVLLVARLN